MANTTLYPTADAFVYSGAPDTNYGDNATLMLRTWANGNQRTFLKFDLSGLPAGAVISLAKLRITCYQVDTLLAGVTDAEARRVADDSWNEVDPDGITWTNQPDYGDVEDTTVPAVGVVEWDITSFAQAELAGDKTVSICLKCKVESYDATVRGSRYRSREYNGDDPELYIEYTAVDTYTKTFTADAHLLKRGTKTFDADAHLLKRGTKAFTADAYLLQPNIKGFLADAHLLQRNIKAFDADAVLRYIKTKSFTADAHLLQRNIKTFAADAHLLQPNSKGFLTDAHLLKRYTKTFTVDALLTQRYSKGFMVDGWLLQRRTKTFKVDAILTSGVPAPPPTIGTFGQPVPRPDFPIYLMTLIRDYVEVM